MSERIVCGICGMSFAVGPKNHSTVETVKCPECHRSFYHGADDNNIVHCGIEPRHMREWRPLA